LVLLELHSLTYYRCWPHGPRREGPWRSRLGRVRYLLLYYSAEHDELPTPAYVAALAPLAKKRALAQMRLSGASIQTNLRRGADAVPYSQRLCPRGCAAAVDTEQHVLFECLATEAARARYWDDLGLDAARDMRCLMDKVYQQKDVGLVMDFVYEASNLIPGPTA
jgi:hypothetical protein